MLHASDKSPSVSSWQSRAGWLLTLLTCVLVSFAWMQGDEATDLEPQTSGKLVIERIQPLEVSPGGALAITYSGSEVGAPAVTATLDKQEMQVLFSSRSRLVVRVPADVREGRAKLRLHQGEEQSKKREVWLRGFEPSRVIELGVVGIAIFVLGLRTLARGLRSYAGNRLRTLLARLTQGVWRSFGVGLFSGAATQSTVTTTGVLVGLLSSNLLPVTMALAIILGSQLGSAAVALAVPLGSRAAVLLMSLGVIWVSLAADRHQRALAKVLLGFGLLFFGFETLRSGFQPLVAHPNFVRLLGHGSSDAVHLLLSVLAGTVMTAVLQGPGPAFALVLGLAESSEIVGVQHGLTLLSGAPLGVAVATSIVAWPFGGSARRWAIGHLILGSVATLLLAVSAAFWAALVERWMPPQPGSESALLPAVAAPLITGVLLSHGLVVGSLVLLLPKLSRWLETATPSTRRVAALIPHPLSGLPGAEAFALAIANLENALQSLAQLWQTSDRAKGSEAERSLAQAQDELAALLATAKQADGPAAESVFAVGLALLNVRDSLAWMQRIVERGIEWGVTPEAREVTSLQRLHELVTQGLKAVAQSVTNRSLIDPDAAREREIWLNAEDSRARSRLEHAKSEAALAYTRHWSAVCAAYEEVGNQLFHAHDALLGEADDD